MPRRQQCSLLRRGVALALVASAVGAAHAASLGGVSAGTLDVWSYPADIAIEDTTPPTITRSISPAANVFGWHNTAATVTFTCADDASGVASCSAPVTITDEAAGQVVVGAAVDNAGNTASTSVTLDIDLTGPVVQIVGVADGEFVQGTPTVSCTASDALSGVNGTCVTTVTPTGVGTFTVTATAGDRAGNATTQTASYTVLSTGDGIQQTGDGGVVVLLGGFVDGKIEEDATEQGAGL